MSLTVTTPARTLSISCPCNLPAVRAAAKSIRGFLEEQGVVGDEANTWELLIAEAGNNAVLYVSPPSDRLPVQFAVEVSIAAVEVHVRDHTGGFDLPEQFELPDPLSESGRGLYLMHSLSDSLEYFRGRGANCLMIRKRRSLPECESPSPQPSIEVAMLESTLQTMTEELAASYETLSAIFRFSEDLNRTSVDDAFLVRWFDRLTSIAGADWIVVRMVGPDRQTLETTLTTVANPGLAAVSLAPGTTVPSSVERTAAHTLQDVWFDAARPLAPDDPLSRLGSELAGFTHPLHSGETLIGIITTGHFGANSPFTAGQVNVIQTLADFLGIQIRNIQYQQDQLQARLLERDYDIASRLQQNLLPRQHPALGPWRTLGSCRSAQRVGGDFYDAIAVGEDGLLLAVADVMGKGLPAALFATIFRTLLRSHLELAPRPAEFLAWLNRHLSRELSEADMFITAQLAYVDVRRREVRIANAGHPPPLLAGANVPARECTAAGLPLGIDPDETFVEQTHPLPANARLILYSDGVTELAGSGGAPLGSAPLLRLLEASAAQSESAEATLARFTEHLANSLGQRSAGDDQTLVLLCETAPALAPSAT